MDDNMPLFITEDLNYNYSSLTNYNMAFNEAYIGKTKLMLKAEKLIGELRKKYMNSTNGYKEIMNMVGKINNDPILRKIEKCFEDEFNITDVYLFIAPTTNFINAFTLPMHYDVTKYELIQNALKKKKGVKFDKRMELGFLVAITSSLLFLPNLSDGEILAILLHEIGHNFEMPLLDNAYIPSVLIVYTHLFIRLLNQQDDIFQAVATMFQSMAISTMQPSITRSLKSAIPNKGIATVRDAVFLIYDTIKLIKKIDGGIVDFILYNIIGFQKNFFVNFTQTLKRSTIDRIRNYLTNEQVALLSVIFGQVSEKIADRFAAYYGYGPDLASSMMKIKNEESINLSKYMGGLDIQAVTNAIPVFGHYLGLCTFINEEILHNLSGDHPVQSDRARDIIQTLKDDLKDPKLPQKMRNDISKSVKEIEASYNLYKDITLDASKKASAKGYVDFSHQMQALLYNIKDAIIPSKLIDLTGTLMRLSGINDIIKDNIDKSMGNFKKLLKEEQNLKYPGLFPIVETGTRYEDKLFKIPNNK